jgi:hypothetical protein
MKKKAYEPKRDIYGKKIGPPQHLKDRDIVTNLRKGHNDKNDNYNIEDEDVGGALPLNEEALQEIMYEEVHYNRARIGRTR